MSETYSFNCVGTCAGSVDITAQDVTQTNIQNFNYCTVKCPVCSTQIPFTELENGEVYIEDNKFYEV